MLQYTVLSRFSLYYIDHLRKHSERKRIHQVLYQSLSITGHYLIRRKVKTEFFFFFQVFFYLTLQIIVWTYSLKIVCLNKPLTSVLWQHEADSRLIDESCSKCIDCILFKFIAEPKLMKCCQKSVNAGEVLLFDYIAVSQDQ